MYNQYTKSDIYETGDNAGGSGVQSVSEGVGISVDNTDPQNPIVAANLAAGAGIQINEVPESGALEIESTVTGSDLTGTVMHGVIKAPEPGNFQKISIVGLDQFVEASGTISVGTAQKIIKCVGTSGTVNLATCRTVYNTNYAPSQGQAYLKGIPIIIINAASGNYVVFDSSGTINGGASITVLPGQMVMLWTDSQTNWISGLIVDGGLIPNNVTVNGAASISRNWSNYNPTEASANFMHANDQTTTGACLSIEPSGRVRLTTKDSEGLSLQTNNIDRILISSYQSTFYGLIAGKPSDLGSATVNLPHGVAPSVPADGDMWTTTSGVFIRINGTTKQFNLV